MRQRNSRKSMFLSARHVRAEILEKAREHGHDVSHHLDRIAAAWRREGSFAADCCSVSDFEKNTMNSTQDSSFEPGQPLLISVDELSRKMSISTRSIWRRLSCGELIKPVRLGKIVRWRLAEVESWIAAGCPRPDGDSSKGV